MGWINIYQNFGLWMSINKIHRWKSNGNSFWIDVGSKFREKVFLNYFSKKKNNDSYVKFENVTLWGAIITSHSDNVPKTCGNYQKTVQRSSNFSKKI